MEGEGRGGKFLGQWHKLGGNFWKYALSGRGTFFICLSWLKNHRPPLEINNEVNKQSPTLCLPVKMAVKTMIKPIVAFKPNERN